jgi:hypothetical protein
VPVARQEHHPCHVSACPCAPAGDKCALANACVTQGIMCSNVIKGLCVVQAVRTPGCRAPAHPCAPGSRERCVSSSTCDARHPRDSGFQTQQAVACRTVRVRLVAIYALWLLPVYTGHVRIPGSGYQDYQGAQYAPDMHRRSQVCAREGCTRVIRAPEVACHPGVVLCTVPAKLCPAAPHVSSSKSTIVMRRQPGVSRPQCTLHTVASLAGAYVQA